MKWRVSEILQQEEELATATALDKNRRLRKFHKEVLRMARWGLWYDPKTPDMLVAKYSTTELNRSITLIKQFVRKMLFSFEALSNRKRLLLRIIRMVQSLWRRYSTRMKSEKKMLLSKWLSTTRMSRDANSPLYMKIRKNIINKIWLQRRRRYRKEYLPWKETLDIGGSIVAHHNLDVLVARRVLFKHSIETACPDARKLQFTSSCCAPRPPSLSRTCITQLEKILKEELQRKQYCDIFNGVVSNNDQELIKRVPTTIELKRKQIRKAEKASNEMLCGYQQLLESQKAKQLHLRCQSNIKMRKSEQLVIIPTSPVLRLMSSRVKVHCSLIHDTSSMLERHVNVIANTLQISPLELYKTAPKNGNYYLTGWTTSVPQQIPYLGSGYLVYYCRGKGKSGGGPCAFLCTSGKGLVFTAEGVPRCNPSPAAARGNRSLLPSPVINKNAHFFDPFGISSPNSFCPVQVAWEDNIALSKRKTASRELFSLIHAASCKTPGVK